MERKLEGLLVEHCSPTLAGVKAASLFRCQDWQMKELYDAVRQADRELTPLGVRVTILKTVLKNCPASGQSLIYVYRPDRVERLLTDPDNLAFLARQGYTGGGVENLLEQLSRRLCLAERFPHEIGIFLGYPLADVEGFIANQGRNYTCCGCWKSYGDPARAEAYFDRCRRCTRLYRRLYARGIALPRLVAA